MKKHDYNIFTKQELVTFLEKYESNFIFIDTPYDLIISNKMDRISKSLDKNLKQSKQLREEYAKNNNKKDKDVAEYLIKSKKNNEEWQMLDKEYDRLSKLRFEIN